MYGLIEFGSDHDDIAPVIIVGVDEWAIERQALRIIRRFYEEDEHCANERLEFFAEHPWPPYYSQSKVHQWLSDHWNHFTAPTFTLFEPEDVVMAGE